MSKITFCFVPQKPDNYILKRLDKIFDDLVEKVGGIDNVVFAPMNSCTTEETRLYTPDFNPKDEVVGIETSFVVKDLDLVSEEYKEYVRVVKGDEIV